MSESHAARRARALELLGKHGALIVCAAPELHVGADTELRYLPDPDLFYFTGYTEPEAVLVLCPSADPPQTLFVRPRDEERERWTGERGGPDGARTATGIEQVHAIETLHAELPKLVQRATTLYAPLDAQRADVESALRAALLQGQRNRPRTGRGPHTRAAARALLAPLRLFKDAAELATLREAARITIDAFTDAARSIATAAGEWTVEAALEHGMRSRGAMGPAFPSIVAGGARATVLHYTSNDAALARDELLLLDAGARYRMYCADISRTYPIAGRFSPPQRDIYELVLRAHDAAIAAVRPGARAQDMDDAALHVLVDGMLELELLQGSRDEVLESKQYRRYYPHRTSHWLGLEVHDVGDYVAADGAPVPLGAGMVLTVEPGLYVPAGDEAAPAAFRGIAVRLEDDLLVTDAGHEVLTAALPIAADEVAALVRG